MHHPDSGFRRRLVALTRKELRQLLRDRSNLAIGVILPIVLILIFGYGLSLDIRNTPLAIVLEDSSPAARDVAAKLAGSSYFSTVQVASIREAEDLMRQRTVDGILRIPVDFSRRLEQGDGRIQLLLHGADANSAATLGRYVNGALRVWHEQRVDRLGGERVQGGVRIVERMWFNAANSSTWYLVPGLIALIITLVGAFLTSLVVAREWERGRWSPFSSPRCAPRRSCWPRSSPTSWSVSWDYRCAWCRPACCSAYRYRDRWCCCCSVPCCICSSPSASAC